ncbi:hypothetical protein BVG19_g11 [[Candida] boidinii]|nr:hypothetical protein BVG19_g11 [[Candida] boidinii]OWB52289.1 hypothetical protein B5S27_g3862 [[Candida] boidinii]
MFETPVVIGADYERVYEPAEDSFLILDLFEEIKDYLNEKKFAHKLPLVVEVGTGSGIVTTFINKNILPNALFIATDLNPFSCETFLRTNKHNATSFNADTVRSDLTTAIKSKDIDILIFNPPYVPAESVPSMPKNEIEEDLWVDIALMGGPTGMDVTNRLLDSLDSIMAPKGEAYILFCARNKPTEVIEQFLKVHNESSEKWSCELVIHRKAGWEVLSVYRFLKL